MIDRITPDHPFLFVTVSAARARQLLAGCLPRVEVAAGTRAVDLARQEVLAGRVVPDLPEATAPRA